MVKEKIRKGGIMKKALVCGAGGFIGGHLVKKLKREGYWVRGVDIKYHEFAPSQAECEVLTNNVLINLNMIRASAEIGVGRYFFSSSVCVYRDMKPGEPKLTEENAYPALPDNEYGWEKLYSERVALAYGRKYGMNVRIARFENCFGPEGTWQGGEGEGTGCNL